MSDSIATLPQICVDEKTGFGQYCYIVSESNDEKVGRISFITLDENTARESARIRKATMEGTKPATKICVLRLPMAQMFDLDVVDISNFVYGVWTE